MDQHQLHDYVIPKNMSTMSLERRLRQLKEESQKLDQVLTLKLASSQSGQNLLHIGASLSSLPPDLHALLQHLHPVLSQAETSASDQRQRLEQLVQEARAIRMAERRVHAALACAELYADLEAAEAGLKRHSRQDEPLEAFVEDAERDQPYHGTCRGDHGCFAEGSPEDKLLLSLYSLHCVAW